jgi:putative ABC transport system ATP-binding protein
MIKIENLKKSFGERVLFQNVNFNIESGEFLILKGESGCGKTTLLNMVGALEDPDSGKIFIDDKNIFDRKNQMWLYGEKIGFLFQNFALIEHKTVSENLNIIKKKYRSEITIEKSLEKVGLADKLDSKVYTLSGGEQQRVALARLMLKKCDIILADEPTGSLDRENADKVIEILKTMNSQGKTIIMVTHDELYQKIGTRYIKIKDL